MTSPTVQQDLLSNTLPGKYNFFIIDRVEADLGVEFLDRYSSMMFDPSFRKLDQKERYNIVATNYYNARSYKDMSSGLKRFVAYCANISKKNKSSTLVTISRYMRDCVYEANRILYLQIMFELEGYYINIILPRIWQEGMGERITRWYEDAEKNSHLLPPEQSL